MNIDSIADQEFRKMQADGFYTDSSLISHHHPSRLPQNLTALCKEKNLLFMPELRSIETMPGSACALVEKNAVVFQEALLTSMEESAALGLAAHELAHLVFADSGKITRRHEGRADRFSHFFTGDPSGFIGHLRHVEEEETRRLELHKKEWGEVGDEDTKLDLRLKKQLYGSLDDRIANLQRPVSKQETAYFTEAIARYNEKIAQENEISAAFASLKDRADFKGPSMLGIADRTARMTVLASALGADEATVKLASITERLLKLAARSSSATMNR